MVSALNVPDVAYIKKYTGIAQELIVTNAREHGTFYPYTGLRNADGGVIVADGRGRKWQRMYSFMTGVYVGWWGAKGDGKQDCWTYLNQAVAYCTGTKEQLNLPEPYYRYTKPLVIGGQSISASDSRFYAAYDNSAPSYSLQGVIAQNSTKPFSIVGGPGTILWADFESSTLEAALTVGMWGVNVDHGSIAAEFKSIILCSKRSVDKDFRLIDVAESNRKNVGLLMQRCDGAIDVRGMQFHGFDYGLLINGTYFTSITKPKFTNCNTGLYTLGSHSTTSSNMTALDCGLAYHIKSGASVHNQLNTERCTQSLISENGFNGYHGIYFERFGGMPGDKYQIEISGDGTIISSATVTSPDNGNAILVKEGVKNLVLIGSVMASYRVTCLDPATVVHSIGNDVGYFVGGSVNPNTTVTYGSYLAKTQILSGANGASDVMWKWTKVGTNVTVDGSLGLYNVWNDPISILIELPLTPAASFTGFAVSDNGEEVGTVTLQDNQALLSFKPRINISKSIKIHLTYTN